MTMQVGMLATDGLVLASDTLWVRPPLPTHAAPRIGWNSSKIRIDDRGQIAVSCARDKITANRVADGIFSELWDDDHLSRENRIREIGINAASGHDIECIIAFAKPTPSLYLFQYVNNGSDIVSDRILTFTQAGDTANAAIFWAIRYYKFLPTKQLIPLAAHLIVNSNKLNTAMISGLEIVYCDASGFHRLSDQENRDLETESKKCDESIGALIMGNTESTS